MSEDTQQWYALPVERVLQVQGSDKDRGLSSEEAQRRLRSFGRNELEKAEKQHPLFLFIAQFKDFMVLVLLAATLLSILLGEYADALTILVIIVINAVLGFLQEYRAERSLEALRALSAPTAIVLRDGDKQTIPAAEVVVGDIVYLQEGDRVPCDLRLFTCRALQVDESALTGESTPVSKQPEALADTRLPIAEQRNMAFMGTVVIRGHGAGVAVACGMQSQMGQIAGLIRQKSPEQTPLQRRLATLGRYLVYGCLGITALVVLLGLWRGEPLYQMILAGVSLAVASIPEGLPAMVTIALSLGVQRMIRRNAVVRKLPSVETLGSATVICADKTGTLTQNRMTVTQVVTLQQFWHLQRPSEAVQSQEALVWMHNGRKVSIQRQPLVRRLAEIAVLCNNAEPDRLHPQVYRGDPTEVALLEMVAATGVESTATRAAWSVLRELPFDSNRKRMSVIAQLEGEVVVFCKGAPDLLLQRCSAWFDGEHARPLQTADRQKLLRANETMAASALRVLALCYRPNAQGLLNATEEQIERDLVFVGLVGMIDPPRPGVREAVARCRHAGVRTIMITGDHRATAVAVAREIGLLPDDGEVISGEELDCIDQKELEARIERIYVFARVAPEHKLRIVQALRSRGEIVAMTGDGVNDAPAIKQADIGIAMGRSGTEVAKEAAALVLQDDNFATIVAAIEEGRGIYDNIRKFIRYMLASNVGELLVMFVAMLLGMPLPLIPIQILWVNLVTDGLPGIALSLDPTDAAVMERPPHSPTEGPFARGLGRRIAGRGLYIGFASLFVFYLALRVSGEGMAYAQSMAFAMLVTTQLFYVFECRSEQRSIWEAGWLKNRALVIAVAISFVLLWVTLYVPLLQPIFHTVPLNFQDWLLIIALAALPILSSGLRLLAHTVGTAIHGAAGHSD
ncbi:MAG: calcium-translocating P-type ATPase, SERCA-type [Firmicutes bacterium]|nr:calcium-translocating P-type ATPase, SERCA-type [Bacillota bacterium]